MSPCRSSLRFVGPFLAAHLALGQQAVVPAERVKEIQQQVSSTMSKYHIPAVSVAVVLDGKLAWREAFGTADLENLVPATDASTFRLASVSKTITAVAVMQVVEAGKLSLDAPISGCVPRFQPTRVPTVRQLLTHTSGVRHYRRDDDLDDPEFANTRHYASVTASLDQFRDDPLVFPPGTSFLYSTHGFTLLGSCVEQMTGIPFVAYVEKRIFEPAGMTTAREDRVAAIVPNRARPYSTDASGRIENAPLLDTSNRIPGGGFVATATDMARFAIALFDGTILRPEAVRTMFTAAAIPLPGGATVPIALGWAAGGAIGREDVVWMGGNQPGGTAMLFVIPKSRTAVVILTNKGGEGGAVIALANGIARTLGR